MLVHLLIQFAIVTLALWLGGRLLPGVQVPSLAVAFGAAFFLSLISFILQDVHYFVARELPYLSWTFFYLIWDALWLGILSRFISNLSFRRWYHALLLAGFSAVLQTLGWWLIPLPVQ